jgi:hypothetical protein
MRGHIMNTYTIAELNRNPKPICAEKDPVLITSKGHPQSIMINIEELPIDVSIDLARDLYGRLCYEAIQKQAMFAGLNKMTDEDIEAEIKASRAARK